MICEEILISREVSYDDITKAISTVFNVAFQEVLTLSVDQWAETVIPDTVRIIGEITPYAGDFPLRVAFFWKNYRAEHLDKLRIIGEFCEKLHCQALVSDESDNPYTWYLVSDINKYEHIVIDSEQPENVIVIKGKL